VPDRALVIVAVVALIVLGPERLPKAARTMGHLFGRLQRYVSDVKADISREMELDELKKLQQEVHGAAREIETSVNSAVRDFETGARDVERDLTGLEGPRADAAVPGPPAGQPAEIPGVAAQQPDAEPEPPARQASLPGFDKI